VIAVVTSWRGVGATTTAFLLAAELAAEETAWLVEADPAGGVWAGRVRLDPGNVGGLERVAFGPSGLEPREMLGAVAQRIGGVRLVTLPADPYRAHTCHRPRVPWQQMLRSLDGDVVVDVGRHRAGSPVAALWHEADVVVAVTDPEVSDVVATSEWLRASGRVASDDTGWGDVPSVVAVVAAPGGVAFGERAVRDDLEERFGAWLAWEPGTVDRAIRGETSSDRRSRRSPLLAGIRQLASAARGAVEVRV
jgi:Mrp family chromosome partitioning ATPase